tara:strand:+ start:88 stop:612 length:525 start_codon:yes stop_codon:yes gene_type:complete
MSKKNYDAAVIQQKKLEKRLEYLKKRKKYILGLRENLSKNWEAMKQNMVSSPRTNKQAILEAKYKSLNASLKDLDTRILRVGGGKDVLGLLGEKDAMIPGLLDDAELKVIDLTPNRGSMNIGPGDFIRSDGELQSDFLRGTDTKSEKVNNTMDYLNMLKIQNSETKRDKTLTIQ